MLPGTALVEGKQQIPCLDHPDDLVQLPVTDREQAVGARCSRARISSSLSLTSIHSISERGVMMVRMERSASDSTPLTM